MSTLSATNIGIGITNPTTSSLEIVKNVITASDLINMRYDLNNGLRIQQTYVATNDFKQIFNQKNSVDTVALTIYKGYVGIGNTDPGTYKLNVTGTINASNIISSGNVGIGITNPTTAKLVINGTPSSLGLDI